MSGQPSPSKSATQTPGPRTSRIIAMPLLPLKWTNVIPACAVTSVNWISAGRDVCACSVGTQPMLQRMRLGKSAWHARAAQNPRFGLKLRFNRDARRKCVGWRLYIEQDEDSFISEALRAAPLPEQIASRAHRLLCAGHA